MGGCNKLSDEDLEALVFLLRTRRQARYAHWFRMMAYVTNAIRGVLGGCGTKP